MDIHDHIQSLRPNAKATKEFKQGYKTARHAAAAIAITGCKRIAELEAAIACADELLEMGMRELAQNELRKALEKDE